MVVYVVSNISSNLGISLDGYRYIPLLTKGALLTLDIQCVVKRCLDVIDQVTLELATMVDLKNLHPLFGAMKYAQRTKK